MTLPFHWLTSLYSLFSFSAVPYFGMTCNFFLEEQGKRSCHIQSFSNVLVRCGGVWGAGGAFCIPMIRTQSLRDLVTLGSEFHKSFSVFLPT